MLDEVYEQKSKFEKYKEKFQLNSSRRISRKVHKKSENMEEYLGIVKKDKQMEKSEKVDEESEKVDGKV